MGERRINWGADAADAKYRTEDTGNPGDFVVVEDLVGNTVLLQYNDTTGQFEFADNVDFGSNDLSGVGALTATSVTTDEVAGGIVDNGGAQSRVVAAADGDRIYATSVGAAQDRLVSTTATSPTKEFDHLSWMIQWDTLSVGNLNPVIGLASGLQAGNSETVRADLYNNTDGEQISGTEINTTNISNTALFSGFQDYTPTTTSSPIIITIRVWTDGGTSSESRYPTCHVGYEL